VKVGTGYSNQNDSWTAGRSVVEQALRAGDIDRPSLLLAFCSNRTDPNEFFHGMRSVAGDGVPIVGGSAIGVITNSELSYTGHPCAALALQADMPFCRVAVADELHKGETNSGKRLAEELHAFPDDRALMVFYDSIKQPLTSGCPLILNSSAPLIQGIESVLSCHLPIFGAGLLGDYEFNPAFQFCGTHVGSQSVAAVMFYGALDCRHRIMHGCTPLDGVYHRGGGHIRVGRKAGCRNDRPAIWKQRLAEDEAGRLVDHRNLPGR
jgi:hypothetical protein